MSDEKAKEEVQLLSADDVEGLLAGDDLATADVYVPEWKRTVRLRQMTAAEAVQLGEAPRADSLPLICALSIVDEHGKKIIKDHKKLVGKSAAALSRIQEAALKLNALDLRANALRAMVIAKNG
jgi:hypothetical protein